MTSFILFAAVIIIGFFVFNALVLNPKSIVEKIPRMMKKFPDLSQDDQENFLKAVIRECPTERIPPALIAFLERVRLSGACSNNHRSIIEMMLKSYKAGKGFEDTDIYREHQFKKKLKTKTNFHFRDSIFYNTLDEALLAIAKEMILKGKISADLLHDLKVVEAEHNLPQAREAACAILQASMLLGDDKIDDLEKFMKVTPYFLRTFQFSWA